MGNIDLNGTATYNIAVLRPEHGTPERVSAAEILDGFDMHQCAVCMRVSEALELSFECGPDASACAQRGEIAFTASAFCSEEKRRGEAILKVLKRMQKYRERGFRLGHRHATGTSG